MNFGMKFYPGEALSLDQTHGSQLGPDLYSMGELSTSFLGLKTLYELRHVENHKADFPPV